MIPPEWKRDLLQMIDLLFVKQDDLFEQDKYPNDADRESLALIILPCLAHPGVIEFLRTCTDWTDDEINEIAGKKVV